MIADKLDKLMPMWPTIVAIPHEHIALELCAELVKRGKTFRCERKASGWEFEVLP